MVNSLEFRINSWLERSAGAPPENATFGELEIRAGDLTITELEDRVVRTVRSAVRVSAVHLARWLASNWWRLRWEPHRTDADWRMSHEIGAAGGGFLWPFLSIASDGQYISLDVKSGYHGQSIRFLQSAQVSVPAITFESAVDAFIDGIISRTNDVGAPDEEFSELWQTVQEERRSPDMAELRRREALLGLDPEMVPQSAILGLYRTAAWMGVNAVDEVLADATFDDADARIHQIKNWSADPDVELSLLAFGETAKFWRTQSAEGGLPWERGAALARLARDTLGLGNDPIDSSRLGDLIGADFGKVAPPKNEKKLAAGFVSPGRDDKVGLVVRRRHLTSRRFEVARLIADAIEHPSSDRVLPITDCGTARQKFQRSFAQEFLCPIDAIRNMVTLPEPTAAELENAAEHFGVSEWTVQSAIVNRGLVGREYLPQSSWHLTL